ncbi:MAG: 50S ribosomal protein L29 [Acidimicrobiales bacterium]
MGTRAAELRLLDDEELGIRLANARQELFNLRFQMVTGQLDNSARIGQLRKEVARLLTFRREREIEAYEAEVYGEPGGTGAETEGER